MRLSTSGVRRNPCFSSIYATKPQLGTKKRDLIFYPQLSEESLSSNIEEFKKLQILQIALENSQLEDLGVSVDQSETLEALQERLAKIPERLNDLRLETVPEILKSLQPETLRTTNLEKVSGIDTYLRFFEMTLHLTLDLK